MARNEVEVLFGKLRQRHIDQAASLSLRQTELLKLGSITSAEETRQLIGQQIGRAIFLDEYTPEVIATLTSKGINMLEDKETALLVELEVPVPTIVVPVVEEDLMIPQTFVAPDGWEFGGKTGKLLAFLAYEEGGWIPKRRDVTIKYLYGVANEKTNSALSALIGVSKKPNSTPREHGVIIESRVPSPELRTKGVKAFDWLSLVSVVEKVTTLTPTAVVPDVEEEGQINEGELNKMKAAMLADVMLAAYRKNPDRQQQLGMGLGQADINKLEQIRQQIGVIKPEMKSKLMKEAQDLVSRFLADVAGFYDELDKKPGFEDTLITLSYFTPLATDTEESFNQFFTDTI